MQTVDWNWGSSNLTEPKAQDPDSRWTCLPDQADPLSPGLERQLDRELSTTEWSSEPRGTYPWPLKIVKTDSELKKELGVPHLCFLLSPNAIRSSLWIPSLLPNLLTTKIQLNKFKDHLDFIKWFVNGAASHLANRKGLSTKLKEKKDF